MWSKLNSGHKRWIALLITAPVVAGLVIAVKLTGFFQLLEWAIYDQFFCLRPTKPIDERILIVAVDESDINYLGKWPIPDAALARLIKILNQHQPAAIGLDLYRDLPVEPGHQDWLEVMKSTPNLIGVEKAVGTTVAPPDTLSKMEQVALTDLLVDADGKVRRALLSYRTPEGQLRFGLGSKLALIYLEAKGITLEILDDAKKHYRLGRSIFVPFKENDGGYVRTNSGGYQIFLNYRGQQDRFRTVTLTEVLENQVKPELIRDRLIFVGSIAASLNDEFYTPYSSRLSNAPQPTPGVVIHASLTSHMLSAALDGQPLIRVWAEPWEWLWILAWSGIGATLHWGLLDLDQYRKQIATRCTVGGLYIFLTGGILVAGSYFAFLAGWWIPVIPPLVALSGSAMAITSYQILKLQQQRTELAYQKFSIEQEKIKAEATSQAKSQLLAKMSHELRTPLNAILGFTQIMSRSSQLSNEHQEYLDIINRSGEHLLELINDVLDLSKIEAGMMLLYESSFDLYYLLDGLEEMFKFKAADKELQLIFQVAPNVPQYITTDKKKLRVCLLNLLSNAIKFTQSGTVTLRVGLVSKEDGEMGGRGDAGTRGWGDRGDKGDKGDIYTYQFPLQSMVSGAKKNNKQQTTKDKKQATNNKGQITIHFEVEDTGCGITPKEIDSLFKDFFQTKIGQQSTEGTGLGLTITQSFVQLMEGEITVSSVVGEGTIFGFNIKVMPGKASEEISPPLQRVIALEPTQAEYRILVADDREENRTLLVKLLEPIGFEVREAANGQEVVALWETWQPHLIWMDTRMPVMDGIEATRIIRARERWGDGEMGRWGGQGRQGRQGDKEDKEARGTFPILDSQFPIPDFQTTKDKQQKTNNKRQTTKDKQQTTIPIIIALTASAFEDKQEEILAAGSDDFVLKPFTDEVIFTKISQYLEVRYLYEDVFQSSPNSGKVVGIISHLKGASFFHKELSTMPSSWLIDLDQAALILDEESITQLIKQIPESQASLAEALINLVNDFRFDLIYEYTQSVIENNKIEV
ncbi:MAG: CHASE2 domain-containing protein [Symploca sp. SIO3E6]|nr:CHASE2 domain-containing protein [Caldora sp. SIO3E6]